MDIHRRADELVRESRGRVTHQEALRELARRGHEARRRKTVGVLHPTSDDRQAFSAVESPRYWWHDRD